MWLRFVARIVPRPGTRFPRGGDAAPPRAPPVAAAPATPRRALPPPALGLLPAAAVSAAVVALGLLARPVALLRGRGGRMPVCAEAYAAHALPADFTHNMRGVVKAEAGGEGGQPSDE